MKSNIFVVDEEPDHASAASGDFELRHRTGSRFFFHLFFFAATAVRSSQVWTRQISQNDEKMGGGVGGW